ncbi:hypothetical protein [Actinomadura opuntiae]|uniref:hypothetical protein n=1 Tax=Actinomadura sp. OS1-43 TaxID=604315 RepID=UPI00255B13BF|nr:hypothetical protein [Actinomadura sp. OS1-43]MDL4819100.1 hypothetical protein [Actinomadura sp. OS1-43]
MAVERMHWADMPAAARETVEGCTGSIYSATTMSEGKNSAIAAVLDAERGRLFVKGLRRDYARRWTQEMEATVAPFVEEISPRCLLRHVSDDWDLLVFDVVEGRHASYAPDSPDLPLLIETMKKLGSIPAPDLPIKRAEQRWKPYVVEPEHAQLLAGQALLHTDYVPDNVIISTGRAVLIDWAWPTRGAGWVDPACLVLRLMASGHSAAQAEELVTPLPAWSTASRAALAAFAVASVNLWTEIAGQDQSSWTKAMELAAREWAAYQAAG